MPGEGQGLLALAQTAAMSEGIARICNDAKAAKTRLDVPHSVEHHTSARHHQALNSFDPGLAASSPA